MENPVEVCLPRKGILLAVCLITLFVPGCYSAGFEPSRDLDKARVEALVKEKGRRRPEDIVFLEELPEQRFVVLGALHAPTVEWTKHYDLDDLIQAMRKKAAQVGADAIINFRTEHNPTLRGGIPYKGLHAYGDAILFVKDKPKQEMPPDGF